MNVIGLMSGTSLDGLDIALVRIEKDFQYQLLAAETVPYPEEWRRTLSSLDHASALDYAMADMRLGHYMGQCVNNFILRHKLSAQLIASHGHTVFHQPVMGLTAQIGDGDAIAAETHLPVVFNFRTLDVALGGQGAPLVPIGDRLLFGQYDACLNLGGIANISFEREGLRVAYDICPCNMALNYLACQQGQLFDRDGLMAREGRVDDFLLRRMNELDYYRLFYPKSLGKEWFDSFFRPLLPSISNISPSANRIPDAMRTTVEHIAQQIALNLGDARTLLVTGGGARNRFLIERLQALAPHCRITVPDPEVVDYKEAILFALLGYLRVQGKINTLRSVTGAVCDSVGGNISGLPEEGLALQFD